MGTKDKRLSSILLCHLTGVNPCGIAIPQGFTPVKWQSRIDDNLLSLVPIEETYNALSLLQHKEVDAVDVEYHVGKYFMKSYPQLGPFSVDVTLPFIDVPFLLSTLRHPEIIKELNLFLINNQSFGYLLRIGLVL